MWLAVHLHHGLKQLMGRWRPLNSRRLLGLFLNPRPTAAVTHMASTATSHRRPRRDSKGPNADFFCRTLTDCTRRGDAAAAMAAFDADAPLRLAAHQYNQLLHLLAAADRSSFPGPTAARRVFAHMLQAGAPPSEATITSLARVTAAAADEPGSSVADEAFQLVATMKDKYGLSPRLRSYGPVLAAFRRAGEAAKAYAVEAHMTASGVSPEEPELAALLDVSSRAADARNLLLYDFKHCASLLYDSKHRLRYNMTRNVYTLLLLANMSVRCNGRKTSNDPRK